MVRPGRVEPPHPGVGGRAPGSAGERVREPRPVIETGMAGVEASPATQRAG